MPAHRLRTDQLEAGATDFVVRLAFLGLFAWWSLELVRPFVPIVIWSILLAVALGVAIAGIVGVLVATPIVAVGGAVLDFVRERSNETRQPVPGHVATRREA